MRRPCRWPCRRRRRRRRGDGDGGGDDDDDDGGDIELGSGGGGGGGSGGDARTLPTAALDARLFTSARAGVGGSGGGGGGGGGGGDARTPPTGAALSYPASRTPPLPNPKLDILPWALCGATPSSHKHARRSVSVGGGGEWEI